MQMSINTLARTLAFCALLFCVPAASAEDGGSPIASVLAADISGKVADGRVIITLQSSSLGKDYLFVRDRTGQKLVRWVRHDDEIQLIAPAIETSIGGDVRTIAQGDWLPSVLTTFPILKTNSDGSLAFDATKLFLSSIEGLPVFAGEIDSSRSSIDHVSARSDLVEVVATQRVLPNPPLSALDQPLYRRTDEPLTLSVHMSIMELPEHPMRPRKYDRRMGYFIDERKLGSPTYTTGITRWRLERSDPSVALSEPKEPIVFYLGKNIPGWMKPWIKAGIESWIPAFEAAGFKNAVVVRDAHDEPDFDERSLRYSVVRLIDKTDVRQDLNPRGDILGAASVDTVFDPRTGEVLKADIIVSIPDDHFRNDYVLLCGALDQRAQQLPLPQSLVGESLRVLAAHEAGHAFGLRDGNYGEFVYPTEKLRDKVWLAKMGFSPSVMNYARCNYVAQPEDNIPPDYLIPRVGPADIHQIRWGYASFPETSNWVDEQAQLDKIVSEAQVSPWKTFLPGTYHISPQFYNEAVDADDPVLSTTLGLKNLRRAVAGLVQTTSHSEDGGFLSEQMYFQALDHWFMMMRHVATMIGGYTFQYEPGSTQGRFTPLPADRQREAMAFLGREAFQTPLYLVNADVTRQFEANGTVDNIVKQQVRLLDDLLNPIRSDRLNNLVEFEVTATPGTPVYGLGEFLGDLRHSIWSELAGPHPEISAYRQGLQAAHVAKLKEMAESEYVGIPVKSALRYQRKLLRNEIERSLPKTTDQATIVHLELMLEQLKATRSDVAG